MEMLPDLRQQANFSLRSYLENCREGRPTNDFVWHLPDDLDPLSVRYRCIGRSCRIHSAKQIGKLLGLYADAAYIPDAFSHRLVFTEEWSERDSLELWFDLTLLTEVAPLVSAGILRFSAPVVPNCQGCLDELNRRISDAAEAVLAVHGKDLKIERKSDDTISVSPSKFDEFAPWYWHKLTDDEQEKISRRKRPITIEALGREVYGKILRDQAYGTMMSTAATRWTGAVTLTGSQANALMLREIELPSTEATRAQQWDANQATDLPWVRDLSLEQVLRLRAEAADALPRFRVKMSRAFSGREEASRETAASDLIGELREEAVEVEQELNNVGSGIEGRFRSILGSVSIVAAATTALADAKTAAIAGLITILGHIHKGAREDHREVQSLQSRPGFVLLKSKEILDHAPKPGEHS